MRKNQHVDCELGEIDVHRVYCPVAVLRQPVNQAWRAKQAVVNLTEAEYTQSYQMIKPFLDKLVETNPGSHLEFSCDPDNKLAAAGFVLQAQL